MDSDKKKKIIVAVSIISGIVIVIAGGICAYLALRPVKVPDPQKDPQAARKFISSKHFQTLTPQQQNNFVRNMRPAQRPIRAQMDAARKDFEKMTPDERRTMMQNMRKVHMRAEQERLDKFFKMSKKEQLAELDRRIAEQDKRREEFRKRRAQQRQNQQAQKAPQQGQTPQTQTSNNNTNNQNSRRRPSAQMRREFEASMSPAARAKFQQYRQMEHMRREGKLK